MSMMISEIMADLGAILAEHGDVECAVHIHNVEGEVTECPPTEARPVWVDSGPSSTTPTTSRR
ncbi:MULTISPECIES: hypothetical protein [Streptomyces]|uniref:hypothetical protein n=1 Tax=Streptomyces TaxID=1883 RepID=UPI003416C1EA